MSGGAAKFAMHGGAAEAGVIGTAKNLAAEVRADTAVRVGDGELERLGRCGMVSADSAREFVVKALALDEHALGLRGGAGDGREKVRESFGGFLVARLQHMRCAHARMTRTSRLAGRRTRS